MELVAEFRKNAKTCRAMAERAMTDNLRADFIELARQWTNLAAEREKSLKAADLAKNRSPH
jgi:hypothetical protein